MGTLPSSGKRAVSRPSRAPLIGRYCKNTALYARESADTPRFCDHDDQSLVMPVRLHLTMPRSKSTLPVQLSPLMTPPALALPISAPERSWNTPTLSGAEAVRNTPWATMALRARSCAALLQTTALVPLAGRLDTVTVPVSDAAPAEATLGAPRATDQPLRSTPAWLV